jgi:hypothetical protein
MPCYFVATVWYCMIALLRYRIIMLKRCYPVAILHDCKYVSLPCGILVLS